MLIIRLIRTGKKNAPSFRIVLTKKTAPPKSGKFLEILGNYNPRLKEVNLKKERIKYWLSQGIQTSETVHNLLVREGVIEGPKIKKKFRIKKEKKEVEKLEKKEKAEKPGKEERPGEEEKPGKEEKGEKKIKKEGKEKKEAKKEAPKEKLKEEAQEEKRANKTEQS